jgi:hypothetical protein
MQYLLTEEEHSELKRKADMWDSYSDKEKHEIFKDVFSSMEDYTAKRWPDLVADANLGALVRAMEPNQSLGRDADGSWFTQGIGVDEMRYQSRSYQTPEGAIKQCA